MADLVPEIARKQAREFQIPCVYSVEEMLADDEIEIVLNLTVPQAHAEVNLRILSAGKHVYTEKPFALSHQEAERVLELAQARGLRVGCAPDTILGGGLQTCRKLIDDGAIGIPYGASGLILMGNAYDGMRPNFQDYFTVGWDPLFDMAPYYLAAMVSILGPVRRVTGSVGQVRQEVKVTNPQSPNYGKTAPITAPMHATATLDFENGVIASLMAAKESFGYTLRFEIYGTEGILFAPDPNMFSGPIQLKKPDGTIAHIPFSHGFTENSRGVGLADMAYAIRQERPHRASGELARHIIEITLGIFEASRAGQHVSIQHSVERPAPLPANTSVNPLEA